MIDLSIAVVTYNNESRICNLLESIYTHTRRLSFKVYIFDNHSTDATVAKVRKHFPEAEIIEHNENIGFGSGHNRLLPHIDSVYHAIVNPDIVLHTDVMTALKTYMDEHPSCVLASPKVLNEDGTEQHLPKRDPTLTYMILGRLGNKLPWFHKYRVAYTRSDEVFDSPTNIAFATGCFQFLRTDAFRQVGGFDERFFLYCEDADLSRRLRKLGDVMFLPQVEVTHAWEQGSAKNLHLLKLHIRSMFLYRKKWKNAKDSKE